MYPLKTYTQHTPNIHQFRDTEYLNRNFDHGAPKKLL